MEGVVTYITCPNCKHENHVPEALRTYDFFQCVRCAKRIDLRDTSRLLDEASQVVKDAAERYSFGSYLDGIHGGFNQKIAEAFLLADRMNREKLAREFPAIAEAFEVRL